MKLINNIFNKIYNEYKLYRSYVPSYASAALSFYIIMMIVPAITLIAIAISRFNIDYTILKDYLNEIVFPNYTSAIINVLESRTYTSVAIVTTILSFWVVSRGVSMIYQISNVMFHNKQEDFLPLTLHTFETTLFILILIIFLITFSVIGPIGEFITSLKSISRIKYLLMFIGLDIIFFILYIILSRTNHIIIPAFIGANISTIIVVVIHKFLLVYFSYANYQSLYGPFSALIMVLFAIRLYAELFYIGLYIVCRMNKWSVEYGKN